ncbi:MAG: crosslink repair DNA glycosylase YcaQ family protein [Thermoplasmata archaeon]
MKITPEKARRVLCSLHGFDSLRKGKKGAVELFDDIPCIQVDPIDPAGRNHDLTLFSRVEDYRREYLSDLLYKENEVFEYYCKMLSIVPMSTYPVFKNKMEKQEKKYEPLFHEYSDVIEYILDVLEYEPVSSLELKEMGANEIESWRTTRTSNRLLRSLWLSGKISIHHREGRRKYYTLTENVIPKDLLECDALSEEEAKKKIAEMIVNSSKLVSPSKASAQWNSVGGVRETRKVLSELEDEDVVFSLEVDGWDGDLYALEKDRERWEEPPGLGPSYVRFLAPLDPLLWNRELFASIFGREYVWEVYKKKEDRKYGHYCLPILYDDEYAGLIEPYFDNGTLEVRNFYLFNEVDEEGFITQFEREINRYMRFLGAEKLEVKTDHPSFSCMSI